MSGRRASMRAPLLWLLGCVAATASACSGSEAVSNATDASGGAGHACVCRPGHERLRGACAPCPPGFYKPTASDEVCRDRCPPSASGPAGAMTRQECRCATGSYVSQASPDECVPCAAAARCLWEPGAKQVPVAAPGWVARCEGSPLLGAGLLVKLDPCPVPEACLGGGCLAGGRCRAGMEGALCSACAPGHGRPGAGRLCTLCRPLVAQLTLGCFCAFSVAVAAAQALAARPGAEAGPAVALLLLAWQHSCTVFDPQAPAWWPFPQLTAATRQAAACLLEERGVDSTLRQTLLILALGLCCPLLVAASCPLCGLAYARWRRPQLAAWREELDGIAELLRILDARDAGCPFQSGESEDRGPRKGTLQPWDLPPGRGRSKGWWSVIQS